MNIYHRCGIRADILSYITTEVRGTNIGLSQEGITKLVSEEGLSSKSSAVVKIVCPNCGEVEAESCLAYCSFCENRVPLNKLFITKTQPLICEQCVNSAKISFRGEESSLSELQLELLAISGYTPQVRKTLVSTAIKSFA